ncbi:class I SAM-dependent methyltransferase [Thioalkalivibrio denitrificans]|uniref:class I SAM-dependent methyltransferase n=1 Tax=Thioalkalivibrio denitrificans TaxID=108003 RepID=UPI001FE3FB3E|nr:class I SAM-dependent methyltransferase [Thioalkalivibrio denitrificans]
MNWLSYGELAWTEPVIAPPQEYAEETEFYIGQMRRHAQDSMVTLLHLGCGAGCNDWTFKRHFRVTGVDISEGMLEVARKLNPEVTYVHGDMRNIDLGEQFDAVAIPDSIDYMVTPADLDAAIGTARRHLKPGGVLLVVAKTREAFFENNFCYTGAREDVEITIFENNYIPAEAPSTYEATIVYLIRQRGELSVYTDRHVLGLFSQAQWLAVLRGAGLDVKQTVLDGAYDRFIMGDGEYPMQVFVGVALTADQAL